MLQERNKKRIQGDCYLMADTAQVKSHRELLTLRHHHEAVLRISIRHLQIGQRILIRQTDDGAIPC
jgi:hypothetical protein